MARRGSGRLKTLLRQELQARSLSVVCKSSTLLSHKLLHSHLPCHVLLNKNTKVVTFRKKESYAQDKDSHVLLRRSIKVVTLHKTNGLLQGMRTAMKA